jgi:hypothetical protein
MFRKRRRWGLRTITFHPFQEKTEGEYSLCSKKKRRESKSQNQKIRAGRRPYIILGKISSELPIGADFSDSEEAKNIEI